MSDAVDAVRTRKLRLPHFVDRALDIAVVPRDNHETMRTKRLLTGALWVSVPVSGLSIIQLALVLEAPLAGAVLGASLVSSALVLLTMWWRPDAYPGVMHVVALVNIAVSTSLLVLAGGLLASGVNSVWGLVSVLGALAIFADRRAVMWLGVFVVATVVSALWANRIEPAYTLDSPEYVAAFNLLVVVLFVFFLLHYYVRQRALLLEQSDALLRNVLPEDIADRLKTKEETIAESFDAASILFADVAGFTPMSADMTPQELVALLDAVFTAFDDLVGARDLEKIKTIGDAYMVAAGVPRPRADHAHAICDLALAIQEQVESQSFGGRRISFRIGINSGPVVAGIIGRKKFSFDLWGDAVNTASRMEAFGTAGHIQITETTLKLVEDDFICEPHGIIDVKGKGPMPVWLLVGRRIPSSATTPRE